MVVAFRMRARYTTSCNGCGYAIVAGSKMVFVPGKMKREYGAWPGKKPRSGAHFHERCNPGFATRPAKPVEDPGDYCEEDFNYPDPNMGDW